MTDHNNVKCALPPTREHPSRACTPRGFTAQFDSYQGSKNAMRVSDHWNVTDSNRINMEDGKPINNRWIIGFWDDAKKMYRKHSEYSLFTPSRTLKEKIAIVDELSNKIYAGNPFAVLQLDNFKHQLQGDSSAD